MSILRFPMHKVRRKKEPLSFQDIVDRSVEQIVKKAAVNVKTDPSLQRLQKRLDQIR